MSLVVWTLVKCWNDVIFPVFRAIVLWWAHIFREAWVFWVNTVNFAIEEPWNHLIGVLALLLICVLYRILFVPYNRTKSWHEVGYDYVKSKSKNNRQFIAAVNEVLRRRRKGDLPPIFPNGWFVLVESSALSKGQVIHVTALGENFAVFRGENGLARVLDAYCPHLGANLAVGGIVSGNCLECPFHGWQFNGKGKCTKVPYSDCIPKAAEVRNWTSCEINGFVFVWYHSYNEEPEWQLPDLNLTCRREWKYCGRSEHYVNSHIQDIPENAGDVAHLKHLHGPAIFGGADIRYTNTSIWTKIMRHYWGATWTPNEAPNKHQATMTLKHAVTVFGKIIKPVTIDVNIKQIGPSVVHLTVNSVFGKVIIVQVITPVEALQQKVLHLCYAQRHIPLFIAKALMLSESLNFERDIMVWNSKKYISHPILVKEDSLINKHRRWYAQFYNDSSPKFKFGQQENDW